MLHLTPIPALQTNYIWTIRSLTKPGQAVIVDPGVAEPVLAYIKAQNLTLAAILITHHHYDHTDGVQEILQQFNCPVYAGEKEPVPYVTHPLADGENFTLPALELAFTTLHIPGHTHGHTAFYGHDLVFTGDTLFAAGCGRNFEGTPEELYASLQRLAALPPETQIYCGHEYTEQNLRFGLTVEPNNADMNSKLRLVELMRSEQQCTLPSSIADELNTNVFLRCNQPAVIASAQAHCGHSLPTAASVFAVLRDWKNHI